MNKVLIIDASESDGRIMSGWLTRAGYDPVVAESIETGKAESAKLPSRRGYCHSYENP